jgi:hypothetical protein
VNTERSEISADPPTDEESRLPYAGAWLIALTPGEDAPIRHDAARDGFRDGALATSQNEEMTSRRRPAPQQEYRRW